MATKPKGRIQLARLTARRLSSAGLRPRQLLFVYGTLMRGGAIHNLLQAPGVRFLGKAKMRGELYWFESGKYPGAVETTRHNQFVYGELYSVEDARHVFPALDRAEECDDGLFERRKVSVSRGGGKQLAWTYLYARNPVRGKLILGGKFLPLSKSA
jgi:gamma-glutamylcyclotransferase (GGCT)/AIG2-like uncharacterized protein YtfP